MDFSKCACSGKSLARLLRPALLASLASGPAHGYEAAQRLRKIKLFTVDAPDYAGIYRALNAMENEGLLVSRWNTDNEGPARKVFTLTREGRSCLAKWHQTLSEYHRDIRELLRILKKSLAVK
jgi:DNA-binding PadR family transcriptional regulator